MEFLLREQKDVLVVQNELMNILPELKDKPYYCELKPYKKRRSSDANAYFHVLVGKIAKVLKVSDDEVKKHLNLSYGTIDESENGKYVGFLALKDIPIERHFKYAKAIGEYLVDGKAFVKYIVYKKTHTLDSAEMARLIDGTIEEAKSLGLTTLTPAELEALKGYKK